MQVIENPPRPAGTPPEGGKPSPAEGWLDPQGSADLVPVEVVGGDLIAPSTGDEQADYWFEQANMHRHLATQAATSMLYEARDCGRLLIQVKGRCPHGAWGDWLGRCFAGTARQAQRYMRLAHHWDLIAAAVEDSNATLKSDLTIEGALSLIAEPKGAPKLPPTPEYDVIEAEVIERPVMAGSEDSTDEHYTPEKYWRPALEGFGRERFDIDTATYAGCPIPARVGLSKSHNALSQDWAELARQNGGPLFAWGNWPYSLNEVFSLWFELGLEVQAIDHAFILEKTDNRTDWYQRLLLACTSYCLIDHPVAHESVDGTKQNGSFFGSTLFYFGDAPELFFDAYCHLGPICQVTDADWYGFGPTPPYGHPSWEGRPTPGPSWEGSELGGLEVLG